jgi:1-aminocyclopropane-1-carboxylate deaminase
MATIDESKAIIQSLSAEWSDSDSVQVDMLRLDLVHPVISGNKWFKLKHNIAAAKTSGSKTILSFGGAYSNHLIATAAAARASGIAAIGIVRGDDKQELTETLRQCEDRGMQLHFVSRGEYKQKEEAAWLEYLFEKFDNPFIIPEGGANEWGRKGAGDIAALVPASYTHVCLSVGTGTTFSGLRNALPVTMQLLGFAPMKGGNYLADEIRGHLKDDCDVNWLLFDQWHFGGFGKWNSELLQFMNEFYRINNIPLDIVYTGKMMFGVKQLIEKEQFPGGSEILCIHTGGLQGNSPVGSGLIY